MDLSGKTESSLPEILHVKLHIHLWRTAPTIKMFSIIDRKLFYWVCGAILMDRKNFLCFKIIIKFVSTLAHTWITFCLSLAVRTYKLIFCFKLFLRVHTTLTDTTGLLSAADAEALVSKCPPPQPPKPVDDIGKFSSVFSFNWIFWFFHSKSYCFQCINGISSIWSIKSLTSS